MKLHWLGPLLPSAGEAGRVGRRIVAALAPSVELTVWLPEAQLELVPDLPAGVRSLDDPGFWKHLNAGGMPIFHLGDSADHSPFWEVLTEVSGIVLLQDFSLQNLIFSRLDRPGMRRRYRWLMEREYGRAGARAADMVLDARRSAGHWADRFPLLGPAYDRARGVISRSPLPAAPEHRLAGPCITAPWPHRRRYVGRPDRAGGVQSPVRVALVCASEADAAGGSWADLGMALAGLAALDPPPRLLFFGSPECAEVAASVVAPAGMGFEHLGSATATLDGLEGADLAINLCPEALAPDLQYRLWDERLPTLVARPARLRHQGPESFLEMGRDVEELRLQLLELAGDEARRHALVAAGVSRLELLPGVAEFCDRLLELADRVERERLHATLLRRSAFARPMLEAMEPAEGRDWAVAAIAGVLQEVAEAGAARPVPPPPEARPGADHGETPAGAAGRRGHGAEARSGRGVGG
ncbi:MAG: hypothetical protein MI919_41335 [Holophagales bacterium]|nr:hypothetical protein [Holophagales bacterium]